MTMTLNSRQERANKFSLTHWGKAGLVSMMIPVLLSGCGQKSDAHAKAKVEQSLKVIEEKKSLNAFTYVAAAQARLLASLEDADTRNLPLAGYTLAVKDNIHVANMPNTAGTKALADFIPAQSSPVVADLKAAGAIVMGKTGLHELAYGITSNNFAFGAIKNPHDPDKTPGGSSGGSAVAVAAGMVDAALGTDTGGSVRLPAALTGIYGYRPTTGRYSAEQVTLISPTRDTIGLMARSMDDIIALDGAITKADQPVQPQPMMLSDMRLGVPKGYFYGDLDPEVARLSQAFLKALEAKGVTLVYADLEQVPELNAKVSFPVVLYETAEVLPRYFKDNGIPFDPGVFVQSIKSPDVKGIIAHAFSGAITKQAYEQALTVTRPKLQQAYRDYFQKHRVQAIVFPTSPITARDIDGLLGGVKVNGVMKDTFATYIRNTDPASNAGIPGISVPAGLSKDGLPVGMEFDGQEGQDQALLLMVQAIMKALKDKQ